MRPNLFFKLMAFAAFLSAGLASAQLRLEQRISFPAAEKIGGVMVVDGDWAALGTTTYSKRVQMCRREAGVWTAVQSLGTPGSVLALSGDWLAMLEYGVITSFNDGHTTIQGVVHMFHRQGQQWVRMQTLRPDLADVGEGRIDFGASLELQGDQLVILANKYAEPGEEGAEHELLKNPLFFYGLHGGSWQKEQVLPDTGERPVGYGAPDLSLLGDWLALGDPGAVSKDWLPGGAVRLFRRQAGQWKHAQTLLPPAEQPYLLTGAQVGLAEGGHLLISTASAVLASTWNGTKWAVPERIETRSVNGEASLAETSAPVLRVAGKVAAVYSNKVVGLLRRSDDGWKLMRSLPVDSPIPTLALSEETLLFLSDFAPSSYDWRAVSFMPVADLEVRLGRSRVESQYPSVAIAAPLISADSELGWQSLLDGDEMPIVVTNTTPGLLPRPMILLSGDMAASFETTPQVHVASLMVPGESATFGVRPREGVTVNEALLTVTFSTGGVLPDFTFTVRWQRSRPVQGPPQVRLLRGAFWRLGQPVHLAPVITGVSSASSPTYRWLRDDVEVPGQNHAVLVLSEARPEHAGNYELEVQHSGGTTRSESCQVAVFDPVESETRLKDGESAQLETRFWGSVQVVWQNPWNYSEDLTTPYLAGITLPTLTVIDGRWIEAGGVSRLEAVGMLVDPVTLVQGSAAVLARHQLVSVCRKPAVVPVHGRVFEVGDSIFESAASLENARDWYGGRNGFPGSVLSASGLPPGIKLKPDGTLEGTFTKAGVYTVTWRVRDASGLTSDPVCSEFIVGQTGPALDAGQYAGWVTGPAEIPGMDFGGCLEMKVEVSGSFSGVLKVPGAVRRFAGKLRGITDAAGTFEAEVALGALPGMRSTKVKLFAEPGMQTLAAEFPCVLKEDESEVTLSSTLHFRPRLPAPLATGCLGSYNTLLDLRESNDEREGLAGTGLMRVTTSKAMVGNVVGTLADGTGFTCASHLMPDDYGVILVLFHEGTSVRFLLGGEERMGSPERPLFLEGALRWKKQAVQKAKLDPEGFDVMLHTEGWRYILPPAGVLLLSECTNQPANAFCQTDFLDDGLLKLTSSHRAIPHSSRAPNRLQRLDVYAPTGLFTGQIVTSAQTLPSGVKVPAKTVPFRGLILPPFSLGGGFYHFAQPGDKLESHQMRVHSF